MPNETLKEERARLKRETKALGKNLDRFDMPSMDSPSKPSKPSKTSKPSSPSRIPSSPSGKSKDAKMKDIEQEEYKKYLDKRFSHYDNKKKPKGENSVKKKKMNMGRQASAGRGGNAPGRLGMAKRMPVPQAISTQAVQPMPASLNAQMQGSSMGQSLPDATPPPGMNKGGKTGKIRGYGMARGGKACKMM
tara:strand:- start:12170 stop:12742 length:573 start_codon:yes stop_codon:yes gene_type:complete